jgi:hypothetical protein
MVQDTTSNPVESDLEHSLGEKSINSNGEPTVQPEVTYPDGGARAWFVAAGAAGILFSTFGYANAFG